MQIHFIILRREEGRSFLLTLPGQTTGRGNGIFPGILVKPRKGSEALFRRCRKENPDGTVFFTRSLRKIPNGYDALDLEPVSSLHALSDNSLFSDREEILSRWEKYAQENNITEPSPGG